MTSFDAQPPSPFSPTPLTPSTQKKEPPPFPSPEAKTASDDKGLQAYKDLLGPGATDEQAKKFRDQLMDMSRTFIQSRLKKEKENFEKNKRLMLYGEY